MEKLGLTMDNKARLVALLVAIFAAAAMRLLPHPPNFSPIAAMALFSGAYLPKRVLAFVAPFAALLLSDAVLGFYAGMNFVYFSFALTVLIGWAVASRKTPLTIGGAAIASSVLFFVLTNFGMWLFSGFYPLTSAGLVACYVAAIPFFQNTLAGDLFFTALLFGGFALLERFLPAIRQPQPARIIA
jgi:pheromone shutdown protein TraB